MSDVAKRRSRLSRQPSGKPVLLTARDIEIFKLLNRYRYLRSTFLQAFFKAEKSRFLHRLGQLYHDGGYIVRPKRQYQYANAMHQPVVYELGERGRQVLKQQGVVALAADRQAGSAGEARHFAHALMICDILASIELGCLRSGPKGTQYDDETTADGLVGSTHGGEYRFFRPGVRFITQEEIISRAPCKAVDNPFQIRVNDELKSVLIDGLFGLEYANGYRFFALEADRGTEPISRDNLSQSSYRKKLLQYQEVISRKLYKEQFDASSFYVLHVTVSERRKQNMMELLKELTGGRGYSVHLFKTMKGDCMQAPPADGRMLTEAWDRAGYPPLDIGRG